MTKDYRSNYVSARSVSSKQRPTVKNVLVPGPVQAASRPVSLTVMCIFLTLVVAFQFFFILRDASRSGNVAWITNIAIVALCVASIAGLRNMRKWGVYIYTFTFLMFLVLYLYGIFSAGTKTLPTGLVLLVLFIPFAVFLYIAVSKLNYMK